LARPRLVERVEPESVGERGHRAPVVHGRLGTLGLQLVEDLRQLRDLLFAQVQLVREEPERPADAERAAAEVIPGTAAPRTCLPTAFAGVRAFAAAALPARVLPPPHHAWVHRFLQLAGACRSRRGLQAWAPCLTPSCNLTFPPPQSTPAPGFTSNAEHPERKSRARFAPGPSRWASVTEPARVDRLQFVHAMISAYEILEKSRAAGQRLPYNEAAVLFAGAVRLAAANDSTLRGRLVRIDDAGALHVEAFDEQAPEAEPAYLAPELLSPDAPDKNDPKVQVYAAGVLGYELLTGKHAPLSGHSTDLSGPLGEVLQLALASDRRTRIEDLKQLEEAVEGVQP